MMLILVLLLLATTIDSDNAPSLRYLICENHRFGFIDSEGRVVIEPRFLSASNFSEDLAPARLNGTYGFIDVGGDFVIEPQFDYATEFQNGASLAYKDGKPFYIDRKGRKLFDFPYSSGGAFINDRAIVITNSRKHGIVDKQGHLILDTAFRYIQPFVNGLSIVTGLNHYPYGDAEKGITQSFEMGVVDTLGRFVIPYGKYKEILRNDGSYFEVVTSSSGTNMNEEDEGETMLIDRSGKAYFSINDEGNSYIDGGVHCGLIKISLYKSRAEKDDDVSYDSDLAYKGFIDLSGKLVINDTTYEFVQNFTEGFSFVTDVDDNKFIIDTTGRVVFKGIDGFLDRGFVNGVAFVSVNGKWGLLDKKLKFLVEPKFNGIDEVGLVGDYFFYKESSPDSTFENVYGIASTDGEIILKGIMQWFDRTGFHDGLLKCVIDGDLAYVNRKGGIVWRQQRKLSAPSKLNIDFMNRGYFYAFSKPVKGDLGGFGGSDNYPKKVKKTDRYAFKDLRVIVRPDIKNEVFGGFDGYQVFVVNGSKKKVSFNAQDSRLYMKVQAKDRSGRWLDIEYLPSSWCGNSYHTLTLDAKTFWTFATPAYEGDFKTKFRIALEYVDSKSVFRYRRNQRTIVIYSNEYDGSVNPGQFWRKEGYSPHGIMDPYNE